MTYPSQREVAEIVAIADPVVRNVAITACYRDLALAVAEIVGRIDVNWLAFGAWASGSPFIHGSPAIQATSGRQGSWITEEGSGITRISG